MSPGEQSVTTSGVRKMPEWLADGLDTHQSVCCSSCHCKYINSVVMLVMSLDATALSRAAFGQGTGLPIHLDDLMCNGDEATLFECPFDSTHNCIHAEDSGVRCNPERMLSHISCMHVWQSIGCLL